jgi:hypothetical protein
MLINNREWIHAYALMLQNPTGFTSDEWLEIAAWLGSNYKNWEMDALDWAFRAQEANTVESGYRWLTDLWLKDIPTQD